MDDATPHAQGPVARMDRLSGLDASFLYLETPAAPMHVGAVLVLPARSGAALEAELVRRVRARGHEVPLFGRRLLPMPLELDHPAWVPASDADPAGHVRRFALPQAGEAALAAAIARLHARPLDRARPLWAMWVIEGVAPGQVAVYAKVHHCAADGAGALAALRVLLDGAAEAPEGPTDDGDALGTVPLDERALLRESLARCIAWPFGAGSALAGLAADALARRRAAEEAGETLGPAPFEAPRTVFSGAVDGTRAVAFARLDLNALRALAHKRGATPNEIFLAVVAGALARHLGARGALPPAPLVAAVPVAERAAPPGLFGATRAAEAEANRVGVMLVGLATDVADAQARLDRVIASSRAARTAHRAFPAGGLRRWALVGGPFVASRAARLHARWRLAERHAPPFNLIVSMLTAPAPLGALGGASIEAAYPLSIVQDGAGLNVTAIACGDSLHVGLVACAKMLPDLADLAGALAPALDKLAQSCVKSGRGRARRPRPRA
jgi:diacylglycerol O-acyltransferase